MGGRKRVAYRNKIWNGYCNALLLSMTRGQKENEVKVVNLYPMHSLGIGSSNCSSGLLTPSSLEYIDSHQRKTGYFPESFIIREKIAKFRETFSEKQGFASLKGCFFWGGVGLQSSTRRLSSFVVFTPIYYQT